MSVLEKLKGMCQKNDKTLLKLITYWITLNKPLYIFNILGGIYEQCET